MTRAGILPALAARCNRDGTQYKAPSLATGMPPPPRLKRSVKLIGASWVMRRVGVNESADAVIGAGAAKAAERARAAAFTAASKRGEQLVLTHLIRTFTLTLQTPLAPLRATRCFTAHRQRQ
jgi:hypothetical protein